MLSCSEESSNLASRRTLGWFSPGDLFTENPGDSGPWAEPQGYSQAERRTDKENEEQRRQARGEEQARKLNPEPAEWDRPTWAVGQMRGRETGKKGCRASKSERSGMWNPSWQQRGKEIRTCSCEGQEERQTKKYDSDKY